LYIKDVKERLPQIVKKEDLLRILSHPVRLCIVRGLLNEPGCSVNEITGCLDMMYITIGGVRKDLPKGIEKKILDCVDDLERRLPDYGDLVLNNPTIIARTMNQIMLPAEVVREPGVTGIGMRSAAGKAYDIRKVAPYARYGKVEFDVPTANYSDVPTRIRFKRLEMFQIIRIIRQVLSMMPEGKVREKGLDGSALRRRGPGRARRGYNRDGQKHRGFSSRRQGGEG
jgi:NADH:ubiquinone oxidoreductase subunit D